jgi:hypothetical protein
MKIERVEDIFIPKKQIRLGTGWEDEIRPFLKSYADFMGDDMSIPSSDDELDKCENILETTLPTDLRLFYKTFGPPKLQEGMFDVSDFDYLTKSWNKQLMDSYSKTEQDVLSKLIVFGDYLGNGNVWCFHADTKDIFYYKHDSQPNINGMFETFGQYIQALIIFSQRDIADGELDDEIEQIVVGLIGQDRVRVWQYFEGWS